jgi:2,3-bisphosphoglycerate-dependent phosphoglycerate mutase
VEAGKFIGPQIFGERVRMLVSPYTRTRQTADGVVEGIERMVGKMDRFDRREELALREISFGLFDGIPDDELPVRFPLEYAHYKKHVDFEGEFYAPMPLGESRIQVADRVKSVFGTILRDADSSRSDPIRNFIIVSHGCTLRAFIMQWLHLPPEWYEAEPNPKNASVTIIESDGVSPYQITKAFEGFERTHTAQDDREDKGV